MPLDPSWRNRCAGLARFGYHTVVSEHRQHEIVDERGEPLPNLIHRLDGNFLDDSK